jgi:hypothetical protein
VSAAHEASVTLWSATGAASMDARVEGSPSRARPWRFAHASVVGSSHVRRGTPCQDASACALVAQAGAAPLVAVVSDGAGSAPLSAIGARTACETVLEECARALALPSGLAALDLDFARHVLARVRTRLARLARRAERPVRDFACTLLFAVVDETRAAFAQLGDGAIVVSPDPRGDGAGFGWVFWPQNGEYVNQTTFATEAGAEERLAFAALEGTVEELALFSDGLQGLVLDGRRRVAHARFFEPMFASVRGAPPGHSEALGVALARYLASAAVQARTDDDKTLVLASRRAPRGVAA